MRNIVNVMRAWRACLAGLALATLPVSLAEADYGPRTTIGANYQQWSNTESTDGKTPGQCGGFGCYVLFQRAPQQRPLIVQHVSCHVGTNTGAVAIATLLTLKGQTFQQRRTSLVPFPTNANRWAVNAPIMHLLTSGERAVVHFSVTADASVWIAECSISGRLLPP